MKSVLAVDPGTHSTGWARFEGGTMVAAGVALGGTGAQPARVVATARAVELANGSPTGLDELVVEYPQVHKYGSAAKADPDDLLALALVAGAVLQTYPDARARLVRPAQWKGQVPKAVMGRRVMEHLTPPERGVVDAVAMAHKPDHNMLDAIGIGLWHLGRLK